MRTTQTFIPTLKETPAEATLASHVLMMRAGLIRKTASGMYLWLPLGLKMFRKVESIIREEMDRAGAQEISCSICIPAEHLHETGRWEKFGEEMFRVKDRHGREFALGPTHEEIFTDLVRNHLTSWRDFPVTLYQIGRKYRDEIRPRFGVMRGREFTMKDAYSFDADEAGLRESYGKMVEAYKKIFTRCGLDFTVVAADSGAIGGDVSYEFMAKADSGEAEIASCGACGYAANIERFPCAAVADSVRAEPVEGQGQGPDQGPGPEPLEKLATPGMSTIESLSEGLGIPASRIVKTLLYRADDRVVALLMRGDHTLNETKAINHFGAIQLVPATADEIARATGGPVGFSGPVGLKGLPVVADLSVKGIVNALVGANEKDMHLKNANQGRDYTPEAFVDLRLGGAGDACPECAEPVQITRGIEVGHVFQLGTVYSAKMSCTYLDKEGKSRPLIMGCYGIGVDRTLAAIIEQRHDDRGIVWPMAMAPYHVSLVPLNVKDAAVVETTERIYSELRGQGVEVLLDDRDERAGFKFKDAELLGIPLRITIGPKGLAKGEVEIVERSTMATEIVPVSDAVARVVERVQAGGAEGQGLGVRG